MTLTALLISCGVGLVFVLVWGLLCYVTSSAIEFKPLFFGGMANFVFFIGGYIASYLARFTEAPVGESNMQVSQIAHNVSPISPAVVIYVALAVLIALLLTNLFSAGFTSSVDRLRNMKALDFTPAGYRDIQIYAGGMIGILCAIGLALYSLHLGSVRRGITFLSVLCGVTLSFGVQGLLYVVFGVFFDYQIFRILNVTAPEVLGTYGVVARKIFGMAITATLAISCVFFLSVLLWLSIRLGSIISAI